MTATMLRLKDVLKVLNENRWRDNVKVMIGGVPTTQTLLGGNNVRMDGKNSQS
jgi:methanogenic corrinoid protein MtbC1